MFEKLRPEHPRLVDALNPESSPEIKVERGRWSVYASRQQRALR